MYFSICGIINETITSSSIDILYYQILRRWQQFVVRTTLSGLPFAAFIEAFFLLAQRKYPTSHSLIDCVSQLVTVCIRQLNQCLQAPASPLIQQSNQYLLQRATRMTSGNQNSTSFAQRSSVVALRSTTAGSHRTMIGSASAPTPRNTSLIQNFTPSATSVTNKSQSTNENQKSTTKSVFPLFFDVL